MAASDVQLKQRQSRTCFSFIQCKSKCWVAVSSPAYNTDVGVRVALERGHAPVYNFLKQQRPPSHKNGGTKPIQSDRYTNPSNPLKQSCSALADL